MAGLIYDPVFMTLVVRWPFTLGRTSSFSMSGGGGNRPFKENLPAPASKAPKETG